MKNLLIADAGSTKIDWAYLSPDGGVRRFQTEGLNALLASGDDMARVFGTVCKSLPDSEVNQVFYYGAGCATQAICGKIRQALSSTLSTGDVFVASDLLGAARALLGHESGIACILGTGSNSCLYDGTDITMNIPPMGFILGDEGSGASLGKRLLGDIAKTVAPEHIRDHFARRFALTVPDILDRVYRQAAPNRFLASMVPFISDNIRDPYMTALVRREFSDFLFRNVMLYPGANEMPVHFTGSIARVFGDILRDAAASAGLSLGTILDAPMPGLITYHTQSKK